MGNCNDRVSPVLPTCHVTSTIQDNRLDLLGQIWSFFVGDAAISCQIEEAFYLCPPIARLLASRGYRASASDLEAFLHPLMSHFLQPNSLCDIDLALDRISMAISKQERITVFGDYDTDGITSTALLKLTFDFIDYPVNYYIPHRLDEGYGMNKTAIHHLANAGTDLIITVDTGIGAHKEIELAKSLGIDVIVTDHHIPNFVGGREDLPSAAIAIINPKRSDCLYPNKNLAGVGVAFKLAHALLKHLDISQDSARPFLKSMLSLVALGTIADIAPMVGENRSIVHYGLDQFGSSALPGIQGLKRALLPDVRKAVTTRKIGFKIAPRLNAAGRTDHAGICVEILAAHDADQAFLFTQKLEEFNNTRRQMEDEIFTQAVSWVENHVNPEIEKVLVVSGKDWHLGVIGIVASRLVERYQKPAVVISEIDGIGKGSARSIRDFDIHSALNKCNHLLLSFGGHSYAAGFQIPNGEIEFLRRELNTIARGLQATNQYTEISSLNVDTIVEPSELHDERFLKQLLLLEPHGPENPQPLFMIRNAFLFPNSITQIKTSQHLKFKFLCQNHEFVAVFFNQLNLMDQLNYFAQKNIPLEIVFTASVNDYYSNHRLDIDVKGIRVSQAP